MMPWTTFRLRVVTPLFGGDDPETDSNPIRVPSIRGALRFWLRAIAAGHGIADLDALWKIEKGVFGSTDRPSPVRLRVDGEVAWTKRNGRPNWATNNQGVKYLLGQGLWDRGKLGRCFVSPNATFKLKVAFSGDPLCDRRFLVAFWAWLTYGGVGARTRRGFGRVRCDGVDGWLPPGWTEDDLRPPQDVHDWEAVLEAVIPERLRDGLAWPGWLADAPDEAAPPPAVPVLAPSWWVGSVLTTQPQSFEQALDEAGRCWRGYRTVRMPAEAFARGVNTPEWRSTLHGPKTDAYPIAALGLPVNYYSVQMPYDGVVDAVIEGQSARRASPVWICPAPVDNGLIVITHAFYARLLPEGAALRLSGKTVPARSLTVPEWRTVVRALDGWLDEPGRLQRMPDAYPSQPFRDNRGV